MSQNQSQDNQFIIKCTVCGEYENLRLKREPSEKIRQRRHRSRQNRPKSKPVFKTKYDYRGNPFDVCINRTEHPYRYQAVLSYLFAPNVLLNEKNKRPIINPPKSESEPRTSKNSEALSELAKRYSLFYKILPLVEQKHPEIKTAHDKYKQIFARYFEMCGELTSSASDDRYKRSLPEWALIVKEANKTSPRTAARKYSGMTPDGREVRLSVKSICEKMNDPKLREFFDTYSYYETIFLMFVVSIMITIGQDPELLAIYEQYKRDYDHMSSAAIAENEEEGANTGQVQVEAPEQNDYEELLQGNYNDVIYNNGLYYDYFYVRHYDPELRKEQKLDRKRGLRTSKTCDGKIEHRIDEKDVPPEIAQKLRLRHSSDMIHAIAMSDTPNRLSKIPIKDNQFWLYRTLLNGMDTNLLDEDGRRRIMVDIWNLLIDMGWPKKLVLEKFLADRYKLNLKGEYREAKKKLSESISKSNNNHKPRLRPFNNVLNERLHKAFRSDTFRQMKQNFGLV